MVDSVSLFESRKFKVLIIAAALIVVPIVIVGIALVLGKATYDQFVEISKWAIGSVGGVAGVFIAAVGYEDGKAKGAVQPITNSGDNVTITSIPPPSMSPPGSLLSAIPGPPPVPKSPSPPSAARSLVSLAGFVLILFGGVRILSACSPTTADRKILDATSIGVCLLTNYDPAQPIESQLVFLGGKCGIEKQSTIVDLLTAHKAAMAREAQKLGGGVHTLADPKKVEP